MCLIETSPEISTRRLTLRAPAIEDATRIAEIWAANFWATTLRLILSVGVNSPPSMENVALIRVKRLIFSKSANAFEWASISWRIRFLASGNAIRASLSANARLFSLAHSASRSRFGTTSAVMTFCLSPIRTTS